MGLRGNYFITKEILKQYDPCREGYSLFCKHFPDAGNIKKFLMHVAKMEGLRTQFGW